MTADLCRGMSTYAAFSIPQAFWTFLNSAMIAFLSYFASKNLQQGATTRVSHAPMVLVRVIIRTLTKFYNDVLELLKSLETLLMGLRAAYLFRYGVGDHDMVDTPRNQ